MLIAADSERDKSIRLNDMTDAEKTAYATSVIQEDGNIDWCVMTSGNGTEAVVTNMELENTAITRIASLYYGYNIPMFANHADGHPLADEDIVQFFTDLTFEAK